MKPVPVPFSDNLEFAHRLPKTSQGRQFLISIFVAPVQPYEYYSENYRTEWTLFYEKQLKTYTSAVEAKCVAAASNTFFHGKKEIEPQSGSL